jgi:beta-mannosidase
VVSRNEHYFKPFKELNIQKPEIKTNILPSKYGFKITLSTNKVAKAVYLSGMKEGMFKDNYFDLLPGKSVEVEFHTAKKMSADEFGKMLKIRSMIDAF